MNAYESMQYEHGKQGARAALDISVEFANETLAQMQAGGADSNYVAGFKAVIGG